MQSLRDTIVGIRFGLPLLSVFLFLSACAPHEPPPPKPLPPSAQQTFHFQRDIQPIFDGKCIACHACYDSPCQLTLTSAQGLLRGASRADVYDTDRLRDADPTRLGIDALSVADWRKRGFWPVQETTAKSASLLARMVELGQSHSWAPNERLPDDFPLGIDRPNVCPVAENMDDYARSRPTQGMPLGMSGLSPQEAHTLQTWLAEGAVVEPRHLVIDVAESEAITQWEAWFNRDDDPRRQLVARYLYEHLFLAHLYVRNVQQPNFFQLLRSSTPPGEPVVPIATTLPNDAPPQGQRFWYRLRPIEDTLVHKTHIVYPIDAARLQRYEQLFFGEPWTLDRMPAYHSNQRANPFETFAAMPARGRYQFMLDNAEYFVRSFIRGPVCHGQVATDVIRDQFWTLFENPQTERYVNDAGYRAKVSPLLGVPGQDDSLIALGPEWQTYRSRRNDYDELRRAEYRRAFPQGASMQQIWNGDGQNHDALLTIFRHFDSANVQRGLIGAIPQTIWVMDYPLLERTYYELVVNYNVFGSVSHQLQTRLYFDLIRNSSELNFLRFVPPAKRKLLLADWYQDMGRFKTLNRYDILDEKAPTAVRYKAGDDPMQAFARHLYHHAAAVMGPVDTINRCADAKACGDADAVTGVLRRLAAQPAGQQPFIERMPELALLRVTAKDGSRQLYSLIHNRAHTNVAFLFDEDGRLDPKRDTLTIAPGVYGSYPNFAFDVAAEDIAAFADQLTAVRDDDGFHALAARWGLRRTKPQFWAVFNDFTAYLRETAPIEASVLDLNRYENP